MQTFLCENLKGDTELDSAKEYFAENGYIVIENVLSSQLIDDLNNSLGEFSGRKQDHWQENQYVKDVAANKFIYNLLKFFYNEKPTPFQTLNFHYSTRQREHVDLIHFSPSPENFNLMCGAWYALEDITEDKGPLIFYPESHKEKVITDLSNIGDYKDYEQHMKKIGQTKYQRQSANIPKGSVIIWASNLIHGGHPNSESGSTRRSMVTHYLFESSNYYWTPILSTPDNIVYRDKSAIINVSKKILDNF